MTETSSNRSSIKNEVIGILAGVAGWLVPGFGHLLLRRWGRALTFFVCAGGLAVTGLLLRGNVFPRHSPEAFDFLGYLADLGNGAIFFLAKFIERSGPEVSRAAGDYGTRFLATAGVVNVLCALDAYEIGSGKKA